MKKILTLMVVGLMTIGMSSAMADPHYRVTNRDGIDLRSDAYGRGKVKCKPPYNAYLHRDAGRNWSRWIQVRWKINGFEWDYKDANGKYCPDWNRYGWVDKTHGIARDRGSLE